MLDDRKSIQSPLSQEDIQLIDSTNLSHLDKHYLRVLAHCLQSFKSMASESVDGALPTKENQIKWLRDLEASSVDESFINVLVEQLDVAARELENMADKYRISPLELTIEHLIGFEKLSKANK